MGVARGHGLAAPRLQDAGELRDELTDHSGGPEQTLHEGARYPLVGGDVVLSGGSVWREWTRHPGAVAVLATRPGPAGESDPEVYLVRQYRHPVRTTAWEAPAGLLDVPGEPLQAAAARELAEEAHLSATTWRTLVDYHTTPGGSAEAIRVFWATDLAEDAAGGFEADGEEAEMTGHWVPLSALVEAVHAGRVHNPSTAMGALALDRVLHRGAGTRPADAPFPLGPVDHR